MRQTMPARICLLLRKFRAQHNIAEHRRAHGFPIRPWGMKPRRQLIDRKAHHIRWAWQVHPMHMQFSNGVFIHTRNRGFHVRAHIHGCQGKRSNIQQHFLIDAIEARFVEKFNTHMRVPQCFLCALLA